MEKTSIQQALFLFESPGFSLLIFLVFSQYGLACKYGITFKISIYNWTQNCIF